MSTGASAPVLARFYAIDEESYEAVVRATVPIDDFGGLAAVLDRCADFGEEADLLDLLGAIVARVRCDGSIEHREHAPT